jgi:outer membrane protein assembly factor BamB
MRALSSLVIAAGAAAAISGQQPAADPAKATFERLCGTCHEPERSTPSRRTREHWLQTVNSMVARGAEGTDAELMTVVDYLTREHGRVNVNLGGPDDIALVLGLTQSEAAAIVQYRRDHGTFEDADAVGRVPGVDARKLARRRDAMVFGSRVTSNAGRVPVAALTSANNWPGVNGGPQREAWARPEAMLSRNTAGAVKLLYSRKLDNRSRGQHALTPPLVLGNLISYRGFKEMVFVGGSSEVVFSIDAVLNRPIWTTRLPVAAGQAASNVAECASGLMGIVMTGSAASGVTGAAIRRPGALPVGVLPAAATSKNPLVIGLASGFGRNGLILSVGSDGNVYPLYQSTGAVFGSPIKFLPPNSSVSGLNLYDNTLYAATIDGCGGPNAVYAMDLATDHKTVVKFETGGSGALGTAGTAIGTDGTVYLQVANGRVAPAGELLDTVLALTAKDLKVKDDFTPPGVVAPPPASVPPGITPAVVNWKEKDVILAGSRDGRLFALDGSALGGADHGTPLAQTPPIGTIRGAFASWEDPDTARRWIYVPVWQAPSGSVSFQMTNGRVSSGAIAAFTLEEQNGRPALVPRWISRDMVAPAAAVANGLVFGLSGGDSNTRATFYVFDAATGRQLFTSGNAISSFSGPGGRGLAVANGRIYFSTQDNTLYCFGIPTEH